MKIKKGFTLVELLVVIAIMAILSTIVVVQITGSKERARDNQRKADLLKIATALEFYRTDNKSYPSLDSSDTTNLNTVLNKGLKDALVPTYLPSMPTDPKNPGSTKYDEQYVYVSDKTTADTTKSIKFSLFSVLERPSADDNNSLLTTGTTCPDFPSGNQTSNPVIGYKLVVIGNCTK